MTGSKYLFPCAKFTFLVLAVFIVAFPLYWITITSFKSKGEDYMSPPRLLPIEWTLGNYKSRLQPGSDGELSQTLTFVKNGAIISLSVTFISMVLASLAGYGFSRFDFPGKKPLLIGLLSTQMFPYVAIMLPIYLVYRSLNLLNTLTGIIIGITGLVLPLGIWMLKTYIDTIDKELEEAALIEGANRIQILTKIIFPIITPAIVSVGMFSFIVAWNHLLYVIILISKPDFANVPLGLRNNYMQQVAAGDIGYTTLCAALVITSAPVVVVFLLLQKYFVSGLTAGATKG